jgi:dCMP deaminase
MGSTAISESIPEKKSKRPSWFQYFIGIADSVSHRSSCERLKVGAVFVKDQRILATGFNGSLPGQDHCEDVGCLVHKGNCIRCVHAETNAICQAARHGVSLEDSWLYVTHMPCINCYKIVLAAGASRVYYRDWYGETDISIYRQFQGMSRLEKL